jgi:hypothetical protein
MSWLTEDLTGCVQQNIDSAETLQDGVTQRIYGLAAGRIDGAPQRFPSQRFNLVANFVDQRFPAARGDDIGAVRKD